MADTTNTSGTGARKTLLERVLGVFAEVHPGEGVAVVVMFLNIFLLLGAYYVLKVVREQLTIAGVDLFGLRGAEIKAYLPAVMAVILIGAVPLYGLLASRLNRLRLIRATTLFVVGCLVLFGVWYELAGIGTAIGLTYYVWIGIVNIFLIAQFWSFANDVYSETQGKRLFAIIGIGQSLGAVLGPKLAKIGADHTVGLLLATAAILFSCLFLYSITDRRAKSLTASTDQDGAEAAGETQTLGKEGGFQLVFRTKYLLLIAMMIVVTNVVNTTGEYILSDAADRYSISEVPTASVLGQEVADKLSADPTFRLPADLNKQLKSARKPIIGQFYGDFYAIVNLVGLLIQMLVVSRIFKYFGVRAALFVLPVIAFGGYAAIGLLGGLIVLRIAKTAENATDYSLQNTVKQALFLPTSREAKYKAKAAIDTFFVRIGDAASAAIVAIGLHVVHFGAREFAFVNVGLCLVWIAICYGIAREHKKLAN